MSNQVNLECSVIDGADEVNTMTFTKSGEIAAPSFEVRQFISFSQVKKDDEGVYECKAVPKRGPLVGITYSLRVIGKSTLMCVI